MEGVQESGRAALSPAQRERVSAWLDELLELPGDERVRTLAARQASDPEVHAEVVSLLRAADESSGFLASRARLQPEPAAPEIAPGTTLDAWRVLRLVGRGGMGEVYEAERALDDFTQRVAIKLLQRGAAGDLLRFEQERRILAGLDHAHIARLIDGGVTAQGRPYMVMEFVDGIGIGEYCATHRLPLADRLRLFSQVCEAVAFAHSRLVVHGDLKPSNVMVDQRGQVKLLDFGIARLVDAGGIATTQAVIGRMTPLSAAPEQLDGEAISTATDVYALGLLLFHLLAGRHPWLVDGAVSLATLRAAQQQPAPLVSHIAARVGDAPIEPRLLRGDLDAIASKTLRPEPGRRYRTVEALRADIHRTSTGAPVEAREGARLYVLGRLLRQHRWLVTGTVAVLLSLTIGLGAASWQAHRAAVERDAARQETGREEAVRYDLINLFRSAVANDAGPAPPSAKTMLDRSAQRVLTGYEDQPQVAGKLVLALADLYGALEDAAGAGALLDAFVAHADASADPVVLADARQKLANIDLLRGQLPQAAALLTQAEAFWGRTPGAYTEERLEALKIRAQLQRVNGDPAAAAETARSAITQRIAFSGRANRETAILYNSLAISLTATNQLPDAVAAYREAGAIYQTLGLDDSVDALVIRGNTGTLELRLGHLHDAEGLLKSAIEREQASSGGSAAAAAAMGNYGRLLTISDRGPDAVNLLRQAVEMGDRFAGAGSPMVLQNRLYLSEALLLTGDRGAARTTLNDALTAANGTGKAAALLHCRLQVALSRVDAANAQNGRAAATLADTVQQLRALGSMGEGALAQALYDEGELALKAHDLPHAVARFAEALTLRQQINDASWELALTQERLAEAQLSGQPGTARALLRQASGTLDTELGNEHPESRRARQTLQHAPES